MEVVMRACRPRIFPLLHLAVLISLVAGLVVFTKPTSAVGFLFASPTGTITDSCTFDDPCSLQHAVDIATTQWVYVAAGTYQSIYDQVLFINKSVTIYGGWDGVTGPDPGLSDPDTYETIIDGQNLRQGITLLLDNGEEVRLDGLTIRNGNGTGKTAVCSAGDAAGCGGGIFISGGTTTIEDCLIEDNVASTTTDATYQTGYGGGIYVQAASVPNPTAVTIRDNIIRSNDASTAASGPVGDNGLGGGIFIGGVLDPQDLLISGNEISFNNAASTTYSGIGDGVLIYGVYGTLSDNDIHDNNPNLNEQGSTVFATHADLTIARNRFTQNHGARTLYLIDFNGTLDSNILINPDAWYGVNLEINEGTRLSTLSNNVIAHHSTANLYLSGYSDRVVHANLYHNTLDGAPYGIYAYQYSYLMLTNNILSGHLTKAVHKAATGNSIYASYTLFHANGLDGDLDLNISPFAGDPLFVDAAAGDYHIQADSAARDRANNIGYAVDFEGDPRPMGSGSTPYDLGADEFWWKLHLPVIHHP
jgi:hypothetical protein